jgi:two-component system, NarL family, nitrate/nitrite response regulator NarL
MGPSEAQHKVFVLVEHRLLRETLLGLLQKKPDIQVVGSGRLTDCYPERIAASECRIVLIDSVESAPPAKLIEGILTCSPDIKIVLIGMDENAASFLEAIPLGISAYLLRDASAAEIVSTVRAVANGQAICPPSLCKTLFEFVAREFRQRSLLTYQEARLKFGLTTRQNQLVALVARGLSNKEIAASLHLSEFTVKNHLRRIMRQVDASSRYDGVNVIRAGGGLPTA